MAGSPWDSEPQTPSQGPDVVRTPAADVFESMPSAPSIGRTIPEAEPGPEPAAPPQAGPIYPADPFSDSPGPGSEDSQSHSRRRRITTAAAYTAAAVLVAAGTAIFVASQGPDKGSAPPAAGSVSPRHRPRTPPPLSGSTSLTALPDPSATAPSPSPSPSAAVATYTPPPSAPQPIGWWDLNDGSGTTAVDSAGHDNGVAQNITWNGGAAQFNGTNSEIDIPEPVVDTAPGSSFTIAAWAYLSSDSAFATVVSQDTTVDSGFYLEYAQFVNRWDFARRSANTLDSSTDSAESDSAPELNTWTPLVGVFNAATDELQLYVNGQPQGETTDPTPYASNGDFVIGRSISSGQDGAYFPGLIGNVEVFNRALTPAQAESLTGY
jgi:hypothetical protein